MHTTALCSPSRVVHADRPQPPLERDGVHHRGRDRLSRATNGRIPFENGFLSEMLLRARLQHVRGRQVAPDADRAVQRRPGPYDRWPLGRGFERFYGFLGGDTNQYYPDLVYDNHQVEPPRDARGGLPPHRGPGRPRDRVHRRRASRSRPTSRSSCTSAPGADARAPPRAARVGRPVQGPVRRRLGRLPREGVRAPARARASCPPGTQLSRARPDVAAWDSARRPTRSASTRGMMEVFAGFLEHTDHHIGRLARLPRADRRARQHARSWSSATTAPAPRAGRTARSTRTCSSTTCPRRSRTTCRRSTTWAARSTSTTTRGAGRGRATRRSGAGSARPTAAASADPFIVHWPARHQGQGRGAHAVRARHRHGADGARRARHRRRRRAIRGVTQSPIQGVSLRPHVRRRARPRRATTRSTSRCSATARSTTTAGARSARCRGRRSPRRAWASARWSITEEKLRELDAKGWELYHVDEDFSETKNLAAEHRDKLIEMIALWYVEAGKYNVLPIDARGTARLAERAAAARAAAQPLRLLPGHVGGLEQDRAAHRSTGRTASPRRSRSRTAPRACWSRRAARPAATRSTSRTTSCTTPTTTWACSSSTSRPTRRSATGTHELRFEFEPTGKPDLAHGKGTPARAQLYIDGKLAGQGDLPVTIPLDIGITEGLTCGRDDGSAVTTDYRGAVRVHRRAGEGRRRRLGRADRGQGRRDAVGDGPPVRG